jgi:hypothetical protein
VTEELLRQPGGFEGSRAARRSGDPERLGHDLEELEVALDVRVRPLGEDDLAADERLAVERVVDDELSGVAGEDAAVRCLDEFRQALDRRLGRVEPRGVARDEPVPDRASEPLNHRVAGSRVGVGERPCRGELEVRLVGRVKLVAADVKDDLDCLAGATEVWVDISTDVVVDPPSLSRPIRSTSRHMTRCS